MGSGAKIALVALLILMVVAVAKFVQNGKEDDGGPPPALTKKDAAGKDAKNANNPRLAPPKSVAGSSGASTPATPIRQPLPPAGGSPASPVVKSQVPGSPASGSTPSPISSPTIPGAQARPPAETVKSPPSWPGPGVSPGSASPGGAGAGSGTPGPLVSNAGSAPVPIPGFSPADNKVGATITPPKSEPISEKREEVKPGTVPLVVSQNPAKRPETEEPPAPKSVPSPLGPPGAINLVEQVKKDVTPPAPGPARAFPVSHVVESGESYWRIAEKYYGTGNGRLHSTISSANGGGKLIAGKTIQIPAPPPTSTDSPGEPGGAHKEPVKPPRPADGIVASDSKYDYYLVQKGDTLTGIAQRRLGGAGKVSVLEAANPSLRYETLREGSRLRIPKK